MNKKLMAVAVAGALAAPALAFAQASAVQVYGRITTEYGYVDQGSGRPNTDLLQSPGGSNIGFRGQEKLGGGLSAWFQCESSADVRGVNQDGFCGRNSAIGLKGGFGNFHIGRWDTPFKRAINAGSVSFLNSTGQLGGVFLMTGSSTGTIAPSNRNVWRRREASMLYYESPTFNGFQVLGGYSAANAGASATNATVNPKPRVVSLGGMYHNGPVALGAGYERHNQFAAVGGANDDRAWTLSGAYTFMGKVKVGLAYIDTKYETSGTTELTKKNWNLGVDWHIAGPHSLEAFYVRAGDSKGNSTIAIGNVAASGSATGAKQYALLYHNALSKRTNVWLGYVKLDNDTNASYALGGTGTPTTGGQSQSAWVVRAAHTF